MILKKVIQKIDIHVNEIRRKQDKYLNLGDKYNYQMLANQLKGIDFVKERLLEEDLSEGEKLFLKGVFNE